MRWFKYSSLSAVVAGGFALALAACSADSPLAPSRTVPAPSFEQLAAPSDTTSPTLLSCPVDTSASASAVIGPHGGEVTVGKFSLRLPPHAVEEPTTFTFTVPASQYLEVDIRANN